MQSRTRRKLFMRKGWIQIGAILLCGLGSCTIHRSSTTQVPTHRNATEQHAPPPPAKGPAVATPKVPVVQPAVTIPMIVTTQPGPIDDRVAYAVGYSAGRRIHDRLQEDGRSADDLLVLKGFIDGLGDRDPAYPRQEVQSAFAEFEAYTSQRRAEKMYADNPAYRKKADENLKKTRSILDQNAEMAGVEIRPDGVQVQLLAAGTGRIVGNAKLITVKNLRVALVDGTLVKATDPDQPEKFAASDALSGLMDAIRGMKVGSKARVWLPPDKAYGLSGKPPVVGPNQGVEFEFELVNAE